MHGAQNIGFGRLAHGVLLVVGQYDHVLPRISEILIEVGTHVLDVVDASSQLAALSKVIDANQ